MLRRGMVRSRHEARQLIDAGRVTVDGVTSTRASTLVEEGAEIGVTPGPRFVSRGGAKLDAALDHFAVKVEGKEVLDVGASTGGFSDCLLRRRAASITAVDVGRGQFDPGLARDPRVTVLERTDIRSLAIGLFPLVVADLSFISLCDVAAALAAAIAEHGDLVALMKPQFEVGRSRLGRGVVTDQTARDSALSRVKNCFEAAGLDTVGVFASPVKGEHGNQEIFLWARKRA